MSDTPKFEVIDRRKLKVQEEEEKGKGREKEEKKEPPGPAAPAAPAAPAPAPAAEAAPQPGPRLVVSEEKPAPAAERPARETAAAAESLAEDMPPPPTAEESRQQKSAYEQSAQRLEDLVRAQNPGAGAQPPVTFDHLVQQLYVSAMIQMGAGTQEGHRPRVDILGAKQTIDMVGILAEKTRGNLTAAEERSLQTMLFDLRLAFLELTNMITLQGMQAPPPPAPGKR